MFVIFNVCVAFAWTMSDNSKAVRKGIAFVNNLQLQQPQYSSDFDHNGWTVPDANPSASPCVGYAFGNCGGHLILSITRRKWESSFRDSSSNLQWFIRSILLIFHHCLAEDWSAAIVKLGQECCERGEQAVFDRLYKGYVDGVAGRWGVKITPMGLPAEQCGLESFNRIIKVFMDQKPENLEEFFRVIASLLEFQAARDKERIWPKSPLEINLHTPDHIIKRIADCFGNGTKLYRLLQNEGKCCVLLGSTSDGRPSLTSIDYAPNWKDGVEFYVPSLVKVDIDVATGIGTSVVPKSVDAATGADHLLRFSQFLNAHSARDEPLAKFIERRNSFCKITCITTKWGPYARCTCSEYYSYQICPEIIAYLYHTQNILGPFATHRRIVASIASANRGNVSALVIVRKGQRGRLPTGRDKATRSLSLPTSVSSANGFMDPANDPRVVLTGVSSSSSVDELTGLSNKVLKTHLRQHGLKVGGVKHVLVTRLHEHLASIAPISLVPNHGVDDDDGVFEQARKRPRVSRPHPQQDLQSPQRQALAASDSDIDDDDQVVQRPQRPTLPPPHPPHATSPSPERLMQLLAACPTVLY